MKEKLFLSTGSDLFSRPMPIQSKSKKHSRHVQAGTLFNIINSTAEDYLSIARDGSVATIFAPLTETGRPGENVSLKLITPRKQTPKERS
ncbi:hypothetical protein CEXT_732751 [Caerostris extrusa]|uniref:Uncharacterized protein n=1 Tax=Caerostris extrusa TaxID=172846 RepID=A0AAV4QY24_CAEEX|nr:hypothetical protein CEXT_732751 [Caerostris extrusa]